MKTIINPLDRYKEEDLKQLLHLVTLGHFFLAIILLMPNFSEWVNNYNAQTCLFYTLSFLVINSSYDWESHSVNIALILSYLILLVGELCFFDIPGLDYYKYGYTYDYSISGSANKGVLVEFFLFTLPIIYIALRVCLIFPIIRMTIWKK